MPESTLTLQTTWGVVRVAAAGGRVTRCDLPRVERAPAHALRVRGARLRAHEPKDRAVLRRAETFVRNLLQGRQVTRPPVDWGRAPPFLGACWSALGRVPQGRTISYAELAAAAGRPRALRAAGQACARNPIPLFVPCHRVLAAGGRLGGFSGGLAWKTLLLDRESARGAR